MVAWWHGVMTSRCNRHSRHYLKGAKHRHRFDRIEGCPECPPGRSNPRRGIRRCSGRSASIEVNLTYHSIQMRAVRGSALETSRATKKLENKKTRNLKNLKVAMQCRAEIG
jgi:hypothetical protein